MGRAKKKKPVTLAGMQDPILAPIVVDNPYGGIVKIVSMRALRDDPLARLHARKQIDDAQFHGGRRYQDDWERAERGAKAIDPGKEAVDGGGIAVSITDDQLRATDRINKVVAHLGTDGVNIVHDVLVSGMTMAGLALKRGRTGKTWVEYYGRLFRDHLNALAIFYGYAHPKSKSRLTPGANHP